MEEITLAEAIENLQNVAEQLGLSAEEAATTIANRLKKLYNTLGGNATTTIGNYSHAEGSCSIAIGNYSRAEGMNNIVLGSGTLTVKPKDIENQIELIIEQDENERWDWLDDIDS